jgi:hypothetical protein
MAPLHSDVTGSGLASNGCLSNIGWLNFPKLILWTMAFLLFGVPPPAANHPPPGGMRLDHSLYCRPDFWLCAVNLVSFVYTVPNCFPLLLCLTSCGGIIDNGITPK